MSQLQALDTLISSFSPENLVAFMRAAAGSFKPVEADLRNYLDQGSQFKELRQIGRVEFDEVRRMIVATCRVDRDLSSRTGKKDQYDLIRKVLRQGERYDAGLFAFYDAKGRFRLSLVIAQAAGTRREFTSFRRYTYFVNLELPNKTFRKQLGQSAAFTSLDSILKTFSIEAVSADFYREFEPKFNLVAEGVTGTKDTDLKKDFALLFVIRVIFLGFVQKKGWLGGKPEFIRYFFNEYDRSGGTKNSFFSEWLKPLFFEALNSPPGRMVAYGIAPFSEETKSILQMSPYLNGELFKPRVGVDDQSLSIPDKPIKDFFDFLFTYNFTIEENTLYDEELELNPEFLGIIFERLVNKADGAVYTPRPEVDLMCRLGLVKWLEKQGTGKTEDLFNLFFRNLSSKSEYDLAQRQGDFTTEEIGEIVARLENITICDPAAGSGAFEVGMLQVLEEVLDNLYSRNNAPDSLKANKPQAFDRKKAIIARSLYGVEVKRWAVWINQLRLWLTLFVDMPDEFKSSMTPLLPNLGFKVRVGDSLVQRIGSRIFPVQGHADLPQAVKAKVTELKKKKVDFFYNRSDSFAAIENDEVQLFSEILDIEIDNRRQEIGRLIKPRPKQDQMFKDDSASQTELDFQAIVAEKRAQLEAEIEDLKVQKLGLKKERPFLWSLEFAEVFFDRDGFDLIIGNPPYVRHELIADPHGKLNSREYKLALLQMVLFDFPEYFAKSKAKIDIFKPGRKPNGQSDLYTFFYIRSLRLLNPLGIKIFICSNSWLDVEYGAWLQEFLLRRSPLHFVLDNHAKRSFASSDVNTVITLLNAPQDSISDDHIVKFVAFRRPFEEAITAEAMLTIRQASQIVSQDFLRIYPVMNVSLLSEGSELDEITGKVKYVGQKWGGIYLRAPDIYFTILEKGKGKLAKLGKLTGVRFGIKTGANDFFYLVEVGPGSKAGLSKVRNDSGWEGEIEDEYLRPVIRSPQENRSYKIKTGKLKYKLFICGKSKAALEGKRALAYITWGERRGYNRRPSVKGREHWWDLGNRQNTTFHFNYLINEIGRTYIGNVIASDNFLEFDLPDIYIYQP